MTGATRVVIGRYGGTVVVTVHGELDLAGGAGLEHALVDLIDGQGNLSVIVDLRDATASDGEHVLVVADAAERADARGGAITLCAPPDLVVEALRARGLEHLVRPSFSSAYPVRRPERSER